MMGRILALWGCSSKPCAREAGILYEKIWALMYILAIYCIHHTFQNIKMSLQGLQASLAGTHF
jgi:hypothetical protein